MADSVWVGLDAGAHAFAGPLRVEDGSAAAPSITFASQTNKGFFEDGNNAIGIALAGAQYAYLTPGVFSFATDLALGASAQSPDIRIVRDAANTLAQRNSTNAQRLNLGQGDTALAAGRLAMGRDAAAAFAPGAGYGMLRWESGTNAGTLKLVAYSGTSTTGVTVVDNVGGGNA